MTPMAMTDARMMLSRFLRSAILLIREATAGSRSGDPTGTISDEGRRS